MSATLRLASCAALVGVVVAAVYVLCPALLAPLDVELSGMPESLRDYFEEQERGQTLRQRLRAVQDRLLAQDQICHKLIDGRLSLAEAARRFGELPDAPDNYQELLRRRYEGDTDEERLSGLIIYWACELLGEEPRRAEELRRRWEAERRALTARR